MQRMTGIDPMFVYSDTSRTPMEVAYVCMFDATTSTAGYSFGAVRSALAERVPNLAPFRCRMMAVPFGLDHPRWVDDPDFDIDNHLHRVALPAPGTDAELCRMTAQIMGRPLHPGQPPWEMYVVEGLGGGRVGLIAKIHHSVIDGVAGAQLLAELLDLSAEGRPFTELRPPRLPETLPSNARLVAAALPALCTSPVRVVRAVREIGRTAVRLARCAVDVETGPVSIPLGAPSTFEIAVDAARAVSFAELGLRQVQELKDRLGVTVNDVVLAVCSGALRANLSEHEQEPGNPLVAIVPVSVRGQPGAGERGNRLSAMFVALANDLPRPLDRLRSIAATSASAKAQERTIGYGPLASAVTEALPPAVAQPMVRLGIRAGALRRVRAGNLMVSNVPGPDFPLFFAGMRLRSAHPLGPVVDGVALNITVQRYCDSLFVGVNACSSVVPNLPALTRAMVDELGRLLDAVDRDGVAAGSRGTGLRLHSREPAGRAPRRSIVVPAGKAG